MRSVWSLISSGPLPVEFVSKWGLLFPALPRANWLRSHGTHVLHGYPSGVPLDWVWRRPARGRATDPPSSSGYHRQLVGPHTDDFPSVRLHTVQGVAVSPSGWPPRRLIEVGPYPRPSRGDSPGVPPAAWPPGEHARLPPSAPKTGAPKVACGLAPCPDFLRTPSS